jgi:hypothetical protein
MRFWPTTLSDVLAGGAFGYYQCVDPNYSRPNPNAFATGLGLPVSMGPIALPKPPPRKVRWGRLFVWTAIVFVGGGVAGFFAKDSLVKVAAELGVNIGSTSAAASLAATPPAPSGSSSAIVAPKPEPAAMAVAPVAPPAPAPRQVVKLADAPAPEPAKPVQANARSARPEPAAEASPSASGKRGKGATKAMASSAGPKPNFDEPFADESGSAPAPKPAASPSRKTDEGATVVAAAKSEPAKKSAKSNDSLDNLMMDAPSDSKGKKHDNKDIDALLKDVQKPRAEPATKKEAPPPAPPLSASDISRVMSGVKTRSKECANKLGQKGVAELKITVGKSGAVSDVHLGGKLVNTPVGACIEKVTRAAVFPPSSGLVFDYRVDAR